MTYIFFIVEKTRILTLVTMNLVGYLKSIIVQLTKNRILDLKMFKIENYRNYRKLIATIYNRKVTKRRFS